MRDQGSDYEGFESRFLTREQRVPNLRDTLDLDRWDWYCMGRADQHEAHLSHGRDECRRTPTTSRAERDLGTFWLRSTKEER